ncbi:hypothetical protein C0581_01995 [Candidatus Parcubacteria bacterium]|nr:MAG: hypothetical protein C0581_01995 [Candidatus Parcubacteria bacterium]
MNLLGVTLDNFSKKEVLKKISTFLDSDGQYKIFTPNPEMLVDVQKDFYFREVLNEGDLNIADGFGLSLVSFGKISRFPGVDLMKEMLSMAEQKKRSVYFLGSGREEIIKNLKSKIKNQFPDLTIIGAHPGYEVDTLKVDGKVELRLDKEKNNELIADIAMQAPDILFVAFGHGKQEKWIHEYLRDLPSVKIAMGVGGSFDFLSENKKRAPKWMRYVGLEWLHRLMREPHRFKRIWKATAVFLGLVLFKRSS